MLMTTSGFADRIVVSMLSRCVSVSGGSFMQSNQNVSGAYSSVSSFTRPCRNVLKVAHFPGSAAGE